MRILVIPKDFPAPGDPGAGIFVLNQMRALRELGHDIEVFLVVPRAPPVGVKWRRYRAIPARYEIDGFPVRAVRAFFPPRMVGMEYVPFQVRRELLQCVERFRPHVVHAHFLIPSGQIAVRQPVPTVVTAHGSDAYRWAWLRPGLRRAASEALERADRVVAVSEFIRRRVLDLRARDVRVIYSGADDALFRPRDRAQSKARFDFPAGRPVIVFAGRLVREKGTFELLEAAAALRDRAPTIALAGTGPSEDALRALSATSGVDARFVGHLGHERLAELFGAADVVTLPSYNEGLPVSLCEALLAGRAAVATPVGGIPEILREGETGLLVPPRDAGALASALRSVLERDDLRERLETNAYAFARDLLTWRVNALAHDRLYRELLSESS